MTFKPSSIQASFRKASLLSGLMTLCTFSNAALITEYFNGYGNSHTAVSGLGTAGDGWAGAWEGGTTVNTHPSYQPNSSTYPAFTFVNPNYNTDANLTGEMSGNGFLRGGSNAGAIAYRSFSSGLTGTVWASVVARPTDGADILFWLDSGGSVSTNFVAFRNTRRPVMRVTGSDFTSNTTQFDNNTPYLFLVKMEVNAGGNDSMQFWIKSESDDLSSEAALGQAIYRSTLSTDIFGDELNDVGFSFGAATSRVDIIRISDDPNGFQSVTAIPEPSTFLLMGGFMVFFSLGYLRRRRG